ncbi:hypothetical protein [Saccharopolyspora sp. NPDC002376]
MRDELISAFDAAADGEVRWAAGQIDGGGTVALHIAESRKPVIAAFNDPAVGVAWR